MKRRSLQLAPASVLVFTACCAGLFLVKITPVYTYKIQHESESEPHFAYERGWPWTWKTQLTTDRASPMGFLAMGLLGFATGMVLFVVGILDVTDYSVELILFGPMIILAFLVMMLAWGFSYRLAVLSRMQRDMQRDLRELLRRTKS